MSAIEDEYDAYYSPLDLEGVCLSQSPRHAADSPPPAVSEPASQSTAPETSDEFDAYDFSEFTATDFAQIDAALVGDAASVSTTTCAPNSDHNSNKPGGPAIEIRLEAELADRSTLVKAPSKEVPLRPPMRDTRSPFQRFRKWNKHFSVSDLVGPAWCEVQFDYGLRQKRHLKPEQRPDAFVTDDGKTINVDKGVAQQNHRVITRGQSVHKVLEREVRPEEVPVEITTSEERWGVRLVNMLASLDLLMESGLSREMPVFGIIHNQIVVGIIDELVRKPTPTPPAEQRRRRGRPPGSGKGLNKRASPATPTKGGNKKSRRTPELSQPQLTSYFHAAVQAPERDDFESAFPTRSPADDIQPSRPGANDDGQPIVAPPSSYMLHISDTKTRRTPSLPPEEDTLSSRLQLMLYHRLLSSLLRSPPSPTSQNSPQPSTDTFPPPIDFPAIWKRLGLDPQRTFSAAFMRDAGLQAIKCLDDLVAAWYHAVSALNVSGVDRTLTLVYRLQPSHSQKAKAAFDQEAVDLARAIEASLNEAPRAWAGGDEQLAKAITENIKGATLEGGRDAFAEAVGAVPDTLTPSAEELDEGEKTPRREATVALDSEEKPSDSRETSKQPQESDSDGEGMQITAAELDVEARILGSKEFAVDDKMLDDYLDNILQWWLGQRPPRGVDIELTRRCLNCEYVEGCEWRAQKAMETRQSTLHT
ncbi:exonuclease V a 5' deoxyribonuclease-domain-containing protein [Rhodofomes roseus]|uniref:Exonuclease V a 5' deoxyribonuclease-domain-containing protein n=1 Tax=Rhodofomes roseus TaxID=34475 RepID=A0ABQ8JXC9_9APHY|nr:exonuclease V a 5' deoxyribonuclease-domain-containing protein [Rhodofomes roseus]KAH9828673.1 exonuclease V a 5' deoxyribonuclease-domain-containing protein [Rhodofomes roseus]